MLKLCEYCQKEFEVSDGSKRRFCCTSHQYKYSHEKASITLGISFNYSAERECLNCHKLFTSKTGSSVKTCSRECGYEYRSKTSQKPNKLFRICKVCGKEFKNVNYSRKACSEECAQKLRENTWVEKYGVNNPGKSIIVKEKTKKHNLEVWGEDSPSKTSTIKQKLKKAWEDKSLKELEEINQKKEETNLKMYGVKCVFQSKEIQNKIKLTNLQNLGVEYPTQARLVLQKCRETSLEHWGVSNPMQSLVVQEKGKQTCLKKYGTDNASKSPEIIAKIIIKNNIKYGANSLTQANISKEIRDLFDTFEFLKELYITQRLSTVKIAEMYGVGQSFVLYKLKKQNIPIIKYDSSGETEIQKYLESLELCVERNLRNILPSRRELDLYIPNKKIAIEFNGIYFHSEQVLETGTKRDGKMFHLSKTLEAEQLGIHLIHIFEDDWNFKQEIVKARLRQVVGVSEDAVYARKCKIVELSYSESESFLNTYHIQGINKSSIIRLGLLFNNDIVGCMTFGYLRKNVVGKESPKEGNYELTRFCTKGRVVGGASKLFKYFINTYNPIRIISYADRHWTSNFKINLYDKLGFKKVSEGYPNYWYLIRDHREYRFNWRKSSLKKKLSNFDPTLSEYQNMLNNGYDRIWGCGSLKYEYVCAHN